MRDTNCGRRDFAEALLARGSSMTATRDRTGLMIAPRACLEGCPPGWVFIAQEEATVAAIVDALDWLDNGRAYWPKKTAAVHGKKKKSDDELLEEVFSSQDYIGS